MFRLPTMFVGTVFYFVFVIWGCVVTQGYLTTAPQGDDEDSTVTVVSEMIHRDALVEIRKEPHLGDTTSEMVKVIKDVSESTTEQDGEKEINKTSNRNKRNTNKDVCLLPADVGFCKAYMPRFYFDTKTRRCKEFIYGGCKGNANNFYSRRECEEKCAKRRKNRRRPASQRIKNAQSRPKGKD